MSAKLTVRQAQILGLIAQDIAQNGRPPTRAEIARTLGFRSANAAEDHLRALERKGYILLTAGTSRGIQLTALAQSITAPQPTLAHTTQASADAGAIAAAQAAHVLSMAAPSDQLLIPLIGRVAAGHPILAAEHVECEIPLSPQLFDSTPDYLLRVRGSSMRDIGILDGDLLAVRSTPEARHGQIVVARLGDDVTVKRLDHQGRRIRLLPENPDFDPIIVEATDDFAIEGIAVGLIRTTNLH